MSGSSGLPRTFIPEFAPRRDSTRDRPKYAFASIQDESTMLHASRIAVFAVLSLAARCVETEGRPRADGDVCIDYCMNPRPYCDATSGNCVACVEDAQCPTSKPDCRTSDHTCFACTSNSECPNPEPICNTGTGSCGPCTSDSDCSGRTATPVCDEASGLCVECTQDTEIARCGGNACKPGFTCGIWPRGSRDVCQSCVSDPECAPGRRCISQTFGGATIGTYCMLERPGTGCGDESASVLPYIFPTTTSSIDGAQATYCLLRSGITCEAVSDGGLPCSADSECGVDGIDDGICRTIAPRKCTYACVNSSDCRQGVTCAGVPAVCEP